VSDERLLSEEEAALVFRRAAELEAEQPGERNTFDAATLERIATEAGLSPAAVRQAIAELRTGRLPVAQPPERRTPSMPATVVVERRMAVPAQTVARRLDGYLKGQMFRVCRRRESLTIWEPARGLAANLARGIDVVDRMRLRRVDGVEVQIVSEGARDGATYVRIVLDLTKAHTSARAGRIATGTIGGLTVVGAAAGVVLGEPLALVLPAAAAGPVAATFYGTRSTYAKHVKRAVDAVELVLDELEHRA
jgi:hypothetical protein